MRKLEELNNQITSIIDKLNHLEADLKKPLSRDIEEHAINETDLTLLTSLYDVEKKNLELVQDEVLKLKNLQ